jgi:hypothetical protein
MAKRARVRADVCKHRTAYFMTRCPVILVKKGHGKEAYGCLAYRLAPTRRREDCTPYTGSTRAAHPQAYRPHPRLEALSVPLLPLQVGGIRAILRVTVQVLVHHDGVILAACRHVAAAPAISTHGTCAGT